jgi:hypothetical protein
MPWHPQFGYQQSLPPEVIMALLQMGQARQGAQAAQGQAGSGASTGLGAGAGYGLSELLGGGAASAAGQTAAQGAGAVTAGMAGASTAGAGNLAAQGAAAAQGTGMGAGGMAAAAPYLGMLAPLGLAAYGYSQVGKNDFHRPYSREDAVKSKGLEQQLGEGFAKAGNDKRGEVVDMFKSRGLLKSGSGKPNYNEATGEELPGTSYRVTSPQIRAAYIDNFMRNRDDMANRGAGGSLGSAATPFLSMADELAKLRDPSFGSAKKKSFGADIEAALAEAQRMLGSAGGQQPMQGMARGPMAPNVQEMIGLRPTPGNLDQFDFDPSKLPAFGGQQIQRAPQAPARSKTSSPGIGKDGKRIKY